MNGASVSCERTSSVLLCNWSPQRRGEGEEGEKYLNKYGQNVSTCNENCKPAYQTNSTSISTKLHTDAKIH